MLLRRLKSEQLSSRELLSITKELNLVMEPIMRRWEEEQRLEVEQRLKEKQRLKEEGMKQIFRFLNKSVAGPELFSSGSTDYFIHGKIGGVSAIASPDTGAERNSISPELAQAHGLPFTNAPKKIGLPNGKDILSLGTVSLPWTFQGESQSHLLECDVISDCKRGLLLSDDFLQLTETLTTHKTRRVKKVARLTSWLPRRISLLGNVKRRLLGYINGIGVEALPDTGSDVMLISEDFARKHGFVIDRSRDHCLELELGDGSVELTCGLVKDVEWRFGDCSDTVPCDFYVMENLKVDVLLSGDFLFHFNVFIEHDRFLFASPAAVDWSELSNIRLIGRYSVELHDLEEEYAKALKSPHAFSDAMIQSELTRRGKIRDAISKLPEGLQEQAREAERERRRLFDESRQRCDNKPRLEPLEGPQAEEPPGRETKSSRRKFSELFKRRGVDAAE